MNTPAFILVNPQMGENIGAVARAMMNFGLRDLRLVAPRDGWPNPKALEMAAHGAEIIKHARIYATTREAIADLHVVYASTARNRHLRKTQLTPHEAAQEMPKRGKVGVLFGAERSGLTNEDIALAHTILTIPTDEKHSSLNIAQASVVVAYEYWMTQKMLTARENARENPATMQEITHLFDHLETALDRKHFFKVDDKKPRMWQNLRATLLKATLSAQDVHTLRGVIAALENNKSH